jgi:hypothetical protein
LSIGRSHARKQNDRDQKATHGASPKRVKRKQVPV